MIKQAVILAGGFGTRLSHIVHDVPKPMAPVNEIPFLKYIYEILIKQGFDEFIFLTGYKAEIIEDYFKNYQNITFIKEDQPLGTGGALLNAYDCLDEEFCVINGDTFFDIDYDIFYEFSKNKDASIALRFTNNISRYGFVDINSDFLINKFIEKGELPEKQIDGYINGGIYYFKKSVLESFYKTFNNNFISMENQIFPELIKQKRLYGLPVGGFFIDIGIPEDYCSAQSLIPEWISKDAKPALFVDKDGTLIVNTEYPHGRNIQIIDNTVSIVKEYAQKGYLIIMVTNQAGIAKDKFDFTGMKENINAIEEYYNKLGIKFDGVEYCPYHIDGIIKEYAKISLRRKPSPGMLLAASEKFKIDFRNSVMIGDNHKIDNINLPYLNCIIVKENACL